MEIFSLLLAVVVGCIFWVLYQQDQQKKTVEEHRAYYQAMLERLKQDPSNAELKQGTLLAGRNWLALTRGLNGTTVVDETSLSNDISAATAGAHLAKPSNADELLKFKQLMDAGVISPDEFAVKKQQLMGQL